MASPVRDLDLRLQNYNDSDFNSCLLPIKNLPLSDDLMARFPLLNKLEGFDYNFADFKDPNTSKNLWIRYMVFFYSKNLKVLEEQFPDYLVRKSACAILAGFTFDPKTGKFSQRVEEALMGENHKCNMMIISLLKHNYSDEYTTYRLMRDRHYKSLLSEDENDVKDTKTIISTTSELAKFRFEFLNGDRSEKVNASLVQHIEEVSLGIRPEEIAERINEGKPAIAYEVYH